MIYTALQVATLTLPASIGWHTAGGLIEFIAQWWRGAE